MMKNVSYLYMGQRVEKWAVQELNLRPLPCQDKIRFSFGFSNTSNNQFSERNEKSPVSNGISQNCDHGQKHGQIKGSQKSRTKALLRGTGAGLIICGGVIMIGFTCCVNYSDMLALTHPLNKQYFEKYIVVTSCGDDKTLQYCVDNGVHWILSDSYKQDGSTFNRAAMLNMAIEYCAKNHPDEWLVSMDADVVIDMVDNNMDIRENVWIADWCGRETMEKVYYGKELDKSLIYGCPRKMVKEKCDVSIESLRSNPSPWEKYPYNLCAYLGYFQMFFNKAARNDESYKTVDNSDTAFLDNNFGINSARTLRNMVCYHLGNPGVNWFGRISEEWK